ncbi:MAG: glycosyltransferase [Chloroflexi bacterium]|jgi:rSAM/selenodomain-associated transferase 2|nr:glycosyltransferase [Chloroflexota bacterium]
MLISVIIPALNEAENIQTCIEAARRGYSADQVEIIVADGGSSDGTPDLAPPDVTVVHSPRGRGVQMNRGAQVATGEGFVFCHADSYLPRGWYEAVVEVLRQPDVSGGNFQPLISPAKGVLHLVNHIIFPTDWRIMFGDSAQFMSREIFEQVGGFQDIPLMEDVEMSRALHNAGRLVCIRLRVKTSSRRFLERGATRQWLFTVWCMIRYLYLGASPEDIARVYRSSREERA